jgi:V8-like Glu-specific endopeptidase
MQSEATLALPELHWRGAKTSKRDIRCREFTSRILFILTLPEIDALGFSALRSSVELPAAQAGRDSEHDARRGTRFNLGKRGYSMTSRYRLLAALPFVAASLWTAPSYGQGANVVHTRPPLNVKQIAKTKAHTNKLRRPDTSQVRPHTTPIAGPAPVLIQGSDAAPTLSGTLAHGSFGIPYTSTRVRLGATSRPYGTNVENFLNTTYPYRAIGKLTFTAPDGGEYHCSATVIRKSLIVTAAHCIQDFGGGAVMNRNFQFTPGSYYTATSTAAQDAPYGTFSGRYVVRPATYANGTDIGDGSAVDNDVAVIVLNKNGAGQFVGQLTGTVGYASNNYGFISSTKTGNLLVAATSTLGYPAALDGGNIMQRADGPTFTGKIAGAWQLWQGSDFTGGSSGGPWIVNFHPGPVGRPVRSDGSVLGLASNMAIVGVTSWGSESPNQPKDNFSSQFRQNTAYPASNYGGYGAGNIGALVSMACNGRVTAGGLTYAQAGYCAP